MKEIDELMSDLIARDFHIALRMHADNPICIKGKYNENRKLERFMVELDHELWNDIPEDTNLCIENVMIRTNRYIEDILFVKRLVDRFPDITFGNCCFVRPNENNNFAYSFCYPATRESIINYEV
jgi:hypothetical protein